MPFKMTYKSPLECTKSSITFNLVSSKSCMGEGVSFVPLSTFFSNHSLMCTKEFDMDSIFKSMDSTLAPMAFTLASKAFLHLLSSRWCVAVITTLFFFLPLVLPLIAYPKDLKNTKNWTTMSKSTMVKHFSLAQLLVLITYQQKPPIMN